MMDSEDGADEISTSHIVAGIKYIVYEVVLSEGSFIYWSSLSLWVF